ncbi:MULTISPECIES: protein kinase [unclassified Flavobacterium]|uniref:protein kinase domain-containing protein n=1 Tax=unclassified Flavobacterium TaxID=196869 RepID=UPI0012909DAE|nr:MULTISPECIES: protein kinase [unclassified Flavobacterium]MQP52686.1 protein kinase [Flavobacterium sp. LMO9]MQP62134.1 protein kinase [Flavobacterium sp. LMO6]
MNIGLREATLNFELKRNIGAEGKNSDVFTAHDKQFDADVVIKRIPKKDFTSPNDYYREAKCLYASKHQNIVTVNYSCEDNDYIYIAMPYYGKGSLESLTNNQFLTVREILKYSIDFLSGVNHIHTKGLIHFDIKPTNILISDSNEALITDFGLAKFTNIHSVAEQDMFYGPDGMRIKDPDKIVENHKASLNQAITDINDYINKGIISNEIGQMLIGVNKSSLKEISKLEKSDQVYNVHFDSTVNGGGVSYDMSTEEVMIGIGADSSKGMIGHELKHGYQFETGQISIVANNSNYGSLYDIGDETESYNRERALDGGMQFFSSSGFKWNNNDVYNFGNTQTPPAYQTLPSIDVRLKSTFLFFNIYSREGKKLRDATIEAGRLGTPVYEVYKGWKKVYQKGINKRT